MAHTRINFLSVPVDIIPEQNLADEIMAGLQEYAELADDAMKKAVKKTATSVKKEISANAPKDTGAYGKSWTTKKVNENSKN